MIRKRSIYLGLTIVTVFAGLASRRYRAHLPSFVAEYAGDTLWGLALFLLVSTILTKYSIALRAAVSLVMAYAVEVSQLYHAPWIDSLRQTMLGTLVLGFGFLWTDLICYTVGIAFGAASELSIVRLSRQSAHRA